MTKRALVIGGGIAGIQTALDIAEAGYPVDIVEKTPSIGGRMSAGQDVPDARLFGVHSDSEDGGGKYASNITLYTYSEVEKR